MKEQLEQRLEQLRAEFGAGQRKLTELEAQTRSLRETLLRISGAIQVLEEELGQTSGDAPEPEAEPGGEDP